MWNTPMYDTTKLTVELREIVDGENPVDIWDFEYPTFYQGEQKKAFERKVIDHYYFRQIGQETVGRFLHCFRSRIREIMPLYIQYYKSVELMESVEDPFEAYNLREEYSRSIEGSATGSVSGEHTVNGSTENTTNIDTSGTTNNTTTEDKIHKFSNTPQGSISNLEKYMSEGSIDDNSVNENGSSSSNSETTSNTSTSDTGSNSEQSESSKNETETYTLTRKGNIGVQPLGSEVNALRSAFINVDMMVINELNDLFLMVY